MRSIIGVSNKTIVAYICCLLLMGTAESVAAKAWRGIVPLRSKRADVRRVLGNPLIGGVGSIELYEKEEGRILVRYARHPCEQGLPADWGNWKVQRDTVVNISITLREDLKVADLKIRDLERVKWYTDASGATYYHDRGKGIEYQVQGEIVTAITYGPMARDMRLRCKKNVPLLRY
jgi:hypothetical protein